MDPVQDPRYAHHQFHQWLERWTRHRCPRWRCRSRYEFLEFRDFVCLILLDVIFILSLSWCVWNRFVSRLERLGSQRCPTECDWSHGLGRRLAQDPSGMLDAICLDFHPPFSYKYGVYPKTFSSWSNPKRWLTPMWMNSPWWPTCRSTQMPNCNPTPLSAPKPIPTGKSPAAGVAVFFSFL